MDLIAVTAATPGDKADWLAMRVALWPEGSEDDHAADIESFDWSAAAPTCLIARDTNGTTLGFAEADLRHDYVNGCETSPAAFLEGIFVRPEARGTGVARALVAAVEAWARQQGCSELASDSEIGNTPAHAMHAALGFDETQRVVYFRKVLGDGV